MITIWLLWALVNGQPTDVKSFTTKSACMASWAINAESLRKAQTDGQLEGAELVPCQPLEVTPPPGRTPRS